MDTPDLTTSKRCTKCGELKPATREFFRKRGNGLRSECKRCQDDYNRAWYADNVEHAAEKRKMWANANPGRVAALRKANHETHKERDAARNKAWREANRERLAAAQKAYSEANRERKSEYYKAYRASHTDHIAERNKAYRVANPGKIRANQSRRRSRERNLPSMFTDIDLQTVLDYCGNCCAVCGQQLNGLFHRDHLDHWIPCSSSDCPGTVPWNMVPLCSTCNQSKSDKPASDWLIEKFGKRKGNAIQRRIETFLNSRRKRE
jgi:5-methylcytosine-specific restriction endonuclease McrA